MRRALAADGGGCSLRAQSLGRVWRARVSPGRRACCRSTSAAPRRPAPPQAPPPPRPPPAAQQARAPAQPSARTESETTSPCLGARRGAATRSEYASKLNKRRDVTCNDDRARCRSKLRWVQAACAQIASHR
eukprot:2431336-Pleurochrysis_carterae.AAC.2